MLMWSPFPKFHIKAPHCRMAKGFPYRGKLRTALKRAK